MMKSSKYLLNIVLAAVVFAAMLVLTVIRTVAPAAVLPELNIPNMVLLTVAALLAEYYLAPAEKRCWACVAALSLLTFGLLPWAAGFADWSLAWRLALVGAVTVTVVTFLFDSITERIDSGEEAKAAPVISALGLFLAAQAFTGIVL